MAIHFTGAHFPVHFFRFLSSYKTVRSSEAKGQSNYLQTTTVHSLGAFYTYNMLYV